LLPLGKFLAAVIATADYKTYPEGEAYADFTGLCTVGSEFTCKVKVKVSPI
jgi:hypothetical protein